jgi:hypothetical protein
MGINVNFNKHMFESGVNAFRNAVQAQDFVAAQAQLALLSGIVSAAWPGLTEPERDFVHSEFMATLQWARVSVSINRGHMASQARRVESARIYQMPAPRTRWNLEG